MKLPVRLLLLLGGLTAAFAIGVAAWGRHEAHKVAVMAQETRRERTAFIDRALDLKGSLLETMIRDYTAWDDMVRFTTSKDPTWAAQNLEAVLPTYAVAGIWVFNKQGRRVYSVNALGDVRLQRLPLPEEALFRQLRSRHFLHFFAQTPCGLAEVRASTIHTTADMHRKGSVYGYFLVARLWDEKYLREIAGLTQANAVLLPSPPAGDPPVPEFTTRYLRPLPAWDDKPLTRLCLTNEQTALRLGAVSQRQASVAALLYVLTLMGLLSFCLFLWVSRPLQRVTRALQSNDPTRLGSLPAAHGEFGHFARLIGSFFEQKHALESAHKELQALHGELKGRNGELQEANARLEALATTDGMTGLPNHRAFQERLRAELVHAQRTGRPVALLLLDVDHFKQYNDSFGHPAGDEALAMVATLLCENSRAGDFPARYGGEEFAVILPEADASAALEAAERLRSGIEAYAFPHRRVTLSVGLVVAEAGAHAAPQDVIAAADQALYAAKNEGRNRVAVGSLGDNPPVDDQQAA